MPNTSSGMKESDGGQGTDMSLRQKSIARILMGPTLLLVLAGVVMARELGKTGLAELRLTYSSRPSAADGFTTYVDSVTRTKLNETDTYRIETTEETGKKTVALVRAGDLQPLLIQEFDKAGQRTAQIEYKNNSASFDIPHRKLHKTIRLEGNYYDINTLLHVLRTFPFGEEETIDFDLVTDGRRGSNGRPGPVGAISMYVHEIGREKIEVRSGTYDSYKLEMGPAGPLALLAGKNKYYFWFTAEKPHYLLKYQDRDGGAVTEFVAKEKPNRPNKIGP